MSARLVDHAFRVGQEISEAGGGYHFAVTLRSGTVLPAAYPDRGPEGILLLDADAPGSLSIDVDEIAAIQIVDV